MKQSFLLIGTICFCALGNAQHQQDEDHAREVKLEGITITPVFNNAYHNMVYNENTPDFVQNLQKEVANYDITEDPNYKRDYDDFKVIFSQTNGKIIATYDNRGKVISTFEKFKNITPPTSVRDKIFEIYPDWTIHTDIYRVTYYKEIRKIYQLQITKGNDKKNLKVDSEGNIL